MPPIASTKRLLPVGLAALVAAWLIFTTLRSSIDNSPPHPIPSLLANAARVHGELQSRRSKTFKEAHDRYVQTHGRLPPPGFEEWFRVAEEAQVCNRDEFGGMYEALRIWWAVKPQEIRRRTDVIGRLAGKRLGQMGRLRVRQGKVVTWEEMKGLEEGRGQEQEARKALQGMLEMVSTKYGVVLPDVDMMVNGLDEPRIAMPYELVSKLQDHVQKGTIIDDLPADSDPYPVKLETTAYDIIRQACPPTSHARTTRLSGSPGSSPLIHYDYPFTEPIGGFLTSPSLEQSSWCDQPDLQDLHASYIKPLSFQVLNSAFPMFSNSKLPGYNDILIPAWFYWLDIAKYNEKDDRPWSEKTNQIFWRGTNTGGYSFGTSYMGWVRSRFVSLLNDPIATSVPVLVAPASSSHILLTDLPSTSLNSAFADVAFAATDAHGEPASLESQRLEPTFRFTGRVPFSKNYEAKAVADLDGTAYSGRYWSLLKSNAAVIKSRLYEEAMEATLVPWYHYVPLSVRYGEVWNLLAYFFGPGPVVEEMEKKGLKVGKGAKMGAGHEEELRAIAEQGKEWGRACTKREDMMSYAHLLVLEWARLTSDDRDELGVKL